MTAHLCANHNKVIYATRRDAEVAMVSVMRRNPSPRPGKPMAYFCEHCGGWHFGHQTRRVETASNGRKRFAASFAGMREAAE